MTRFEVLTLFPEMVRAPLGESLIGKAREAGRIDVRIRDIRDHATGRHRVCDDTPYGGGAGMVMKPEPVFAAIEAARAGADPGARVRVVLLTPVAPVFDQRAARRLAAETDHLVLVCGRYEGVDARIGAFVDEGLSIGDYVLSGGEFAALVVVDAVARLLPGVLGNEASIVTESFEEGLLEHPQYTRPPEFRGLRVPDVLLSGDHARIDRWRRKAALVATRRFRPELLERAGLEEADRKLLEEADREKNQEKSEKNDGKNDDKNGQGA